MQSTAGMRLPAGLDQLGHLIDGRIVRGTQTFPVESPKAPEQVARCPAATLALLEEAMAAAARAQPAWAARGEDNRPAIGGRAPAGGRYRDNDERTVRVVRKPVGVVADALSARAAPDGYLWG